MKNNMIIIVFAALASLLIACETSGDGGPVKVCEEVGQQCVYAPGKLGVCQFDAAQKITCMSQH